MVAKKKGKYGIINAQDSILLPFVYDDLSKVGIGLYKVKKGKYYQLMDEKGKILNPGPFEEITQFEYLSRYDDRQWLVRNHTRVALVFYQGKMREIDEKGLFLSEPIEMKKHEGFGTMEELKDALTEALNSPEDQKLKSFVKKICLSDHLLYWAKPYFSNEMHKLPDFNYLSIQAQYYEELVKLKRSDWNDSSFNKNIMDIEDYSTNRRGVVMIKTPYKKYQSGALKNILNDCVKINGYWISAYFLRMYS